LFQLEHHPMAAAYPALIKAVDIAIVVLLFTALT